MTTTIHSNGGGNAQPIEALFQRLASDPLDRTFEAYGDFIQLDPVNGRGEPMTGPGGASFFGNFLTYSHVFRLETDDADLVERLTTAIRANQRRPDYLRQPPPFERSKLAINRKRFSVTQGEVELIYDGRRLEQFGDQIVIDSRGAWSGRNDSQWERAAREFLAKEHEAAFTKAARLVRVSWYHPETNEAGEYLTRDTDDARTFAQGKLSAGADASVAFAL